MKEKTAIFLDRDGTINDEVGYLDSADKLRIIPAAFEAVRLINASGMKAVVITNQAGVAKGLFTEEFVREINGQIQSALLVQGALIDRFYFCPHHPTEGIDPYRLICDCRKPEPGLLHQAAADLNIDLARSYVIGDRLRDVETAHRAGAKGVLVMTGHGQDLMQDAGPDRANELNQPDYVAQDILEAVHWILKNRI
ncbi:MAG: HAD family hydrolase [Deltaproteobacteria bacterium]|nr:MAG: HAD family hydrolase [Deltaproteobacteria bacterium]